MLNRVRPLRRMFTNRDDMALLPVLHKDVLIVRADSAGELFLPATTGTFPSPHRLPCRCLPPQRELER
jgi:hypothetical protein